MDRLELSWRAEEACLNAWPAARQAIVDGWLVRASGGQIRRTNSVNPQRLRGDDFDMLIGTCEDLYAAQGRPALFRILSIAAEIDAPLAARGYAAEGRTLTLFADLGASAALPAEADLTDAPDAAWLALRSQVNHETPEAARVFHAMTDLILLPKTFAAVRVEGAPAAIAYCAIDRGMLVVESVATAAERRGRGLAKQVVAAILDWGRRRGAGQACLQVVADNAPAVAAYRRLGFTTELYDYHYRRSPR